MNREALPDRRNQTLASDRLAEKVHDVLAAGPAEIQIVVPATPTHEHLTWTEGAAHEVAERNLEAAIALFSELGAEVNGEVGDARPMEAIRAALHGEPFDEIIVSTLPLGALPVGEAGPSASGPP